MALPFGVKYVGCREQFRVVVHVTGRNQNANTFRNTQTIVFIVIRSQPRDEAREVGRKKEISVAISRVNILLPFKSRGKCILLNVPLTFATVALREGLTRHTESCHGRLVWRITLRTIKVNLRRAVRGGQAHHSSIYYIPAPKLCCHLRGRLRIARCARALFHRPWMNCSSTRAILVLARYVRYSNCIFDVHNQDIEHVLFWNWLVSFALDMIKFLRKLIGPEHRFCACCSPRERLMDFVKMSRLCSCLWKVTYLPRLWVCLLGCGRALFLFCFQLPQFFVSFYSWLTRILSTGVWVCFLLSFTYLCFFTTLQQEASTWASDGGSARLRNAVACHFCRSLREYRVACLKPDLAAIRVWSKRTCKSAYWLFFIRESRTVTTYHIAHVSVSDLCLHI